NDEFYTCYEYIERELIHYARFFKNKVIYCNCDDHYGIGKGTPKSNFIKYLSDNFEAFGIKCVIATHYEKDSKSTMYILDKDNTGDGIVCSEDILEQPLNGDGDFRSPECIELLKQADIIITNPPFSLFREYVAQLMEYGKKFIIIGNQNAITYKEIFPLIKANKIWVGYGFNQSMIFKTLYKNTLESNRKFVMAHGYNPDDNYIKTPAVCWFTNLPTTKRNEYIETGKKYYGYESMYPKYDNYDAIEVGAVKNMPMDYNGIMGVPITFLDKYNPEQFEILGLDDHRVDWRGRGPDLNGKTLYRRIIIKKKGV
ncbi:MAG: adenine-specific methyltransferase EcoRI family protein, partial [Alphaproteobacteria bacterium]